MKKISITEAINNIVEQKITVGRTNVPVQAPSRTGGGSILTGGRFNGSQAERSVSGAKPLPVAKPLAFGLDGFIDPPQSPAAAPAVTQPSKSNGVGSSVQSTDSKSVTSSTLPDDVSRYISMQPRILSGSKGTNRQTLAPSPRVVPTAPMDKPQEDNTVTQPAQSVTPSDLTTTIGTDSAMQMPQSAKNQLSLSGPNMGLNFGGVVQAIGAAAALGRNLFPVVQPIASFLSNLRNTTTTASGASIVPLRIFSSPPLPGQPGTQPKEDEKKVTPLPSPTPLSNQSMKTDVFSPGEVGQMGGRSKAANPEEHNPRDRSNRFRQSSMFTITPDQAMNFIAKTESSDNSLKSLIREEIRRRIEEEVVKKPNTNNAKLSDEEIEKRLSPGQRREAANKKETLRLNKLRDIANKNKQSKKKPS